LAPILNAQGLAKTYGAVPLFESVGFTVSEGDRIGLIGPNGSGKSTLLGILAGRVSPDSGEVVVRKHVKLSYVAQESQFAPGDTVRSVITAALQRAAVPQADHAGRTAETLGRAGFEDFDYEAHRLSGGWRKRLAIAEALVQEPDILLLDEPTNHLDLAGIEWLEALLQNASWASVVISHDRYFLEDVATGMAELNRAYPDSLLWVKGNYSAFLEKKEAFLQAQAKRQETLENRVRREIEWLRRGPKARTGKSKARIDKAQELIGELSDLNTRRRTANAAIEFSATGRQTKRLIELNQVSYAFGERAVFSGLDFTMTAGMRLGLVGPNGSGKTTLLRLLLGEIVPQAGHIRRAEWLRVVYFEQHRELDPEITLRRALAPDGDSVVYQERVIHVASWAARFLFTREQLNQPVERLSGGERARILIAKLMLEPADVLLLDEPTNDLDIPTLEVLEESLLEFRGALVLVTHDRYLLDRVATTMLGLDGNAAAEPFADYSQWETWQRSQSNARAANRNPTPVEAADSTQPALARQAPRKKLSYIEAREHAALEPRIAEAEQVLQAKRAALEDPAIVSDAPRLLSATAELEAALKIVDGLYARWAELEEKLS
jgi:ATP-binding cassette subfamily F protein uup